MRIIRCPICDEPLPGFANFCAACGKTLTPSPTSTTARVSRPRSLNVPHFFAVPNDDELFPAETMKHREQSSHLSPNNTVPRASIGLLEEDIDVDTRRNTNWHKIVEARPPRTPSSPRVPAAVPVTPLPLPSEYLLPPISPRSTRYTRPSLVMWVCSLLLAAIVVGGLFGVVVTLGRRVLAQKPPHHTEIALQVTPASVALGALITLRGTNFSPREHIGLTRDSTIPIADTGNNTLIQANAQGAFTDTVLVEPQWQAGTHSIHAEDALLHKTASFTILVTGRSSSLRPAHLLLSASTLDLGAGDQATNSTKTMTLTNDGGGQISWQSATTQPWLLLSPKDGIFSGGQSIQVMVAADRSNLRPGSYSAQIIFTSNAGQATLPVKMKTTQLEPGHEAVLQVTPAVLSLTGIDGGVSPPAQVVTVSNPGALPLQWSAAIDGGNNDSGWLSVSPLSGSVVKGGSQAVVIRANISTQLPGTYYAVVTFTGQGSEAIKDSPQSVYISLTISPQCALQVSPGQLAFSGVYQQPGPAAKIVSLNVIQSCAMQLRWSAVAATNYGGPWLNINSSKGTTPSYPAVSVNITGLSSGVYTGSIFFSSTVGTQTLPVSLTLAPPTTPIMNTRPAAMAFSDVLGQPNPPGQAITITNTGGGTLAWHAAATTNFGGNWLAVSSAGGYLYAHQTTSVNVTVSLLAGFTSNTYTGMITITGTDNAGHLAIGSPQTMPVNFTVLPACAIAVAPEALSFAGVVGQPNPATQPVTITANGTCPHALSWSASIANGSWLTTMPASGTVSLSSSAMINIGVVLAGLSANTYTGHVTITATDSVTHRSVGTPQAITIGLTVQPPCMLQAPSPEGETFNSEVGANPHPARQSFTISIIGACTGNIKITPTSTQSWLAITPSAATITGGSSTFTVKVKSASLPVGTVNGSISLAAVDGSGVAITGSPQMVTVTLNVNALPSLILSPGSGGLSIHVASGTITQPFSISNSGGEPMNWTAALDAGAPAFAALSATAGTNLAGGTSTSVDVIVDATGVPGGSTFTTNVTVSAIDPITGNTVAGSPATIPITITIPAPAMQLSTTVLGYSTSVGVNPASQSITLTNIGGDGLTWSAGTPSQSWLTLGLTSGSDNAGATSTLPFSVNVAGLASGSYTATVVITPSVGSAVTVTVNLTVS